MDKILAMDFHFLEGSNPRPFTHLNKLSSPIDRLQFVAKKNAYASEWMDSETGETFWRPKLGDIHVSMDGEFKRYPSISGAYKEAVRIKKLMNKKIDALKAAYSRREKNHQIIRRHYLGRGMSV